MRVSISDRILEQASECPCEHSCLDSKTRCVCPVQNGGNDVVLFVQAQEQPCPYKKPFGFGNYCSCPVRKELHLRYRT